MQKGLLLAVLAMITFAVAFSALQNGSLLLSIGAGILGGFAFYGVMIHPKKEDGPFSAEK